MIAISKQDLLRRVHRLVERCRLQSAYSSGAILAELIALEAELVEIEAFHALTIDTYLAGRYRLHNCPVMTVDPHGVSGRWSERYTRHRKPPDAPIG